VVVAVGHIMGWEHTFVHEIHHLLTAIAGDCEVAPHGATFDDGYRAAEVCEAILRAGESGAREILRYPIGLTPAAVVIGPPSWLRRGGRMPARRGRRS
jgi:hypothetical protein